MTKFYPKRLAPVSSVAALAAVLATFSAPAAANMEALLEKLHAKGVLSDDEYKEMKQEAREAARANRDFKAEIMGDKAKRELPTGLNGAFSNNFTWTSGDGMNSIRLTGRVQTDYRFADNDFSLTQRDASDRDTSSIGDSFELRRARLGVTGTLAGNMDYSAQFNMVGSAPVVDTAFANFKYLPKMNVQFGRFKQPFSLGQLTSSNDIDFAERSYVDQVIPGKKIGAMLHGEPKPGFTYAASVFQEGENELTQEDGEGKRYAGRMTANFAQFGKGIDNTVLHFGVAGVGGDYQLRPSVSSQTTGAPGTTTSPRVTVVGFRSLNRGLSNVYRAQIGGPLTTNVPNAASEFGVDVDQTLFGLESALARGTVKVQGEWVRADYNAVNNVGTNNGQSVAASRQGVKGEVDTWYVQALWNITGEKWSEAYRAGIFRGIVPLNNFKPGSGWGAWQVGVRYSKYDAGDVTATTGGGNRIQSGALCDSGSSSTVLNGCAKQNADVDSYGIGLNWILNPMARVMFEWTRTDFGGETLPLDINGVTSGSGATATLASDRSRGITKEDIFSFRAQVMF